MKRLLAPLIALAIAGAASLGTSSPARSAGPNESAGLAYIVNSQNPVNSIAIADLIAYYQKTKRQWPDGTPVRFIDRAVGSPERAEFLSRILKQSESEVELYWIEQKLHTGYAAPIQVSSDSMVIETVKAFPGAIGYISARVHPKDPRVKEITVTGSR